MESGSHGMKTKAWLRRSGILPFLFLAACGSGGNTEPVHPQGASVTGNAVARNVPFSREGFEQSKAYEPALAIASASPLAAPFHYAPAAASIPIPGGTGLPAPSLRPKAPSAVPASLAPALSSNFAGLTDTGWIPPDTMGAVGPSHLLSTLNGGVGIFSKATGAKLSQVTLQAFWASLGTGAGEPANFPFDPKVAYDQHSGRFVITTLGSNPSPDPSSSWLMIAVSATSDPGGTWNKWAISTNDNNTHWADFDGLGLDNNNIYVTANMYGGSGGVKIWVIPKPQLLAGANPIAWTEFFNPPGYGFTMQPAHVHGASSAEYLVHQGYSITGPPLQRFLRLSSITFPSGTPTFTDLGYIRVDPYPIFSLPKAPQPGTTRLIETNDQRLLNAVMRNGTLWTTHTVADNANSMTQVAWYQLDPATASPTSPGVPVQQGRISHATRSYYYPSIAVNATGDVGIGFSGSSPAEYAGAYYTARGAYDSPGTVQEVATLKAGLSPYFKDFGAGRNRWGDYSATCVDPVDDLTFWTLQEYAASQDNTWATWWGSFFLASPPAAPAGLSATPVSPAQIALGWTDQATNETGFQIERKTGAGGTYARIATAAADAAAYGDSGLAEGTTYFYRVRAVNSAGNSAYSNEASAATPSSGTSSGAGTGGGGGCSMARIRAGDCDGGSALLTLLSIFSPMAILVARRRWTRRHPFSGDCPPGWHCSFLW
jgi:hypothetical protein